MLRDNLVPSEILKKINPIKSRFFVGLNEPLTYTETDKFLDSISASNQVSDLPYNVDRLELLLRIILGDVDYIGKLPISRETNDWFGQSLRNRYLRGGRISLQNSRHPALIVTSMVFSARYSDVNERNFWTPYFQQIWHIPYNQTAYGTCRRYFLAAKDFLSNTLGFSFPIYQDGDVVRPINYQAIIPYYLQDDFGRWMVSLLENFPFTDETTRDEDAIEATQDWLHLYRQSADKLVPTLQRFIKGIDVSGKPAPETAAQARLLFNRMLNAFELYREGENAEIITQILPNSIERELWQQVKQEIILREEQKNKIRRVRPHVGWVWELDTGSLLLRLTNVELTSEPEMCVWTSSAASLRNDDTLFVDVVPWKAHGGWFIDDLLMPAGNIQGSLSVLSKDHDLEKSTPPLFTVGAPPLPKADFTLYRLTQQNYYAVPLTEHEYKAGLNDGDYIVSMKDGIELVDQSGQPVTPIEHHSVPQLIREHLGHTTANTYRLVFPITITQSGCKRIQVKPKQDSLRQPELSGDQLVDLSKSVPPVFLSRDIDLLIPNVFLRPSRVILTLTSSTSGAPIIKRLDQLLRAGNARIIETGINIEIGQLIGEEPATYQINLRQDLTSLLTAPLEFTYLADIQVKGVDLDTIYTPNHLPTASMSGLSADRIRASGDAEITNNSEEVTIRWRNLTYEECRLYLMLNDQRIPLAWQIKRVDAWIEVNGRSASVVHEEEFDHVRVRVAGIPRMWFSWRISGDKRDLQLDAHGQYEKPIWGDALSDMLRHQPDTSVELEIEAIGERWHVGRFVRQLQIKGMTVSYDERNRNLTIQIDAGGVSRGAFTFGVHLLDDTIFSILLGQVADLGEVVQFDLDLPSGRYAVDLACDEVPIDLHDFPNTFTVAAQSEAQAAVVVYDHTPFSAMLLTAEQLASRVAAGEARNWMLAIQTVHDTDRWAQLEYHLPHWAIYSDRVLMTTYRFWHKLSVIPERGALRGRVGLGRLVLKLDGHNPTTTHVKWLPTRQVSDSVRLYICVPPAEPDSEYYLLDEYNLWPVYMCERCGWFVGSRGGYARVSPRLWIDHRHGRATPSFQDVAYDTRTSYRLLASTRPQAYTPSGDAQWLFNRLQMKTLHDFFLESDESLGVNLALATPEYFREAWRQAERADTLTLAMGSSRERTIRHLQGETHSGIEFPAAMALMRILSAFESESDFQSAVDILILAFLLRLQAEARPQAAVLFRDVGIRLSDLRSWTETAIEQTPALLNWALVWAELLLVHAAS